MNSRLLAIPLATLLFSILDRIKKGEPDLVSTQIWETIKLDGKAVSCQAIAFEYLSRAFFTKTNYSYSSSFPHITQSSFDNLLISFSKNVGSPLSTYHFVGVLHMT